MSEPVEVSKSQLGKLRTNLLASVAQGKKDHQEQLVLARKYVGGFKKVSSTLKSVGMYGSFDYGKIVEVVANHAVKESDYDLGFTAAYEIAAERVKGFLDSHQQLHIAENLLAEKHQLEENELLVLEAPKPKKARICRLESDDGNEDEVGSDASSDANDPLGEAEVHGNVGKKGNKGPQHFARRENRHTGPRRRNGRARKGII